MNKLRMLSIGVVPFLFACSGNSIPGEKPGDDTPAGSYRLTGDQQADWKSVESIETEAKAVAHTDGCGSSADCRSAPVGSKACGGPRYYIPYCAKTTDSAALFAKLADVAKAEQAYNTRYKVVSTCEFRMPPTVESVGGACVGK